MAPLLWAGIGCSVEDAAVTASDTGSDSSGTASPADDSNPEGEGSTTGAGPGSTTESADGSTTGGVGSDGAESGSTEGTGGASDATSGSLRCGAPIAGIDGAVGIVVGDEPEPPSPGGTTGGGTTTGGPPPDPDTLRIRLSNRPASCADPDGRSGCSPEQDSWRMVINVPPDMIAPGTYNLADMTVGYSVVGVCDGGDGGFGGGTGVGGTLIIESIGPDGINGCVEGVDESDFDPNGAFQAANCSAI